MILHLYIDGDQCKIPTKDDEMIAPKVDEKQCNNPLAGLANAVNAITNGVMVGDESQTIPISATVIVNNKTPPKAMVKPQVLTHVIEGFVIQEGVYSKVYFYQLYKEVAMATDQNEQTMLSLKTNIPFV